MGSRAEHGSEEAHARLVKACLCELALMGFAAWENHRRAVKVGGRWVSLGKAGRGDIQVIFPAHFDGRTYGVHGEVECKTGSATQRKDQRIHMRVVRNSGGIYLVARSAGQMRDDIVALGFEPRFHAASTSSVLLL